MLGGCVAIPTRVKTMRDYDGVSEAELAARLGIPRVVALDETESTLDVAHQLAEQGAAAGTLIVADTQRSGRGRMGRAWTSMPGQGVWSTLIERVADPRALDVLSIRVGLALAELLDAIAGEHVRLKWPNDLLISGGKLGGILCETRWAGQTPSWVAVGVGVNVVAPQGIEGAAGLPPGAARLDVLAAIVRAVRLAAGHRYATGHLHPDELAKFAARDALAGARIASPSAGVAAGIDATGALIVQTVHGVESHRTGTVVLAEDKS